MCVHGAPVLKRYTLNLCLMEHNAEQAASAAKPERFNSPSKCREAAALGREAAATAILAQVARLAERPRGSAWESSAAISAQASF